MTDIMSEKEESELMKETRQKNLSIFDALSKEDYDEDEVDRMQKEVDEGLKKIRKNLRFRRQASKK